MTVNLHWDVLEQQVLVCLIALPWSRSRNIYERGNNSRLKKPEAVPESGIHPSLRKCW